MDRHGIKCDLVLPQQQIDDLGLQQSGTVKAILADGSEVALQRYFCLIDSFGEQRDMEVVANEGEYRYVLTRDTGPLAKSYPGRIPTRSSTNHFQSARSPIG